MRAARLCILGVWRAGARPLAGRRGDGRGAPIRTQHGIRSVRAVAESPVPRAAVEGQVGASTTSSAAPRITLLYDGECPVCMKEVRFLRERDGGRGRIAFVDIAAPDYDPSRYGNVTFEQAMGRIHGLLPDGTIVKKVDVFRLCYEAVGMGWVWAAARNPLLKRVANGVYDFWADRRLQWTGRGSMEKVLAERQAATASASAGVGAAEQAEGEDEDCSERCVIDWDDEDSWMGPAGNHSANHNGHAGPTAAPSSATGNGAMAAGDRQAPRA